MVLATLRLAKEELLCRRLVAAASLMLLFTTGSGGGRWIILGVSASSTGGGGRSGGSLIAGGGFWSSAAAPSSNVGIAIAVTAMAGLALAATLVYSRRGSLKSPWSRRRRKHALLPKQWKSFLLPDGKLCDGGVKFLKKVRSGGVDPTIRAEVWPFLLGVYDVNSSKEERESIRSHNRKEYDNLRKQCRQIIRRIEKNTGSKENAESSEHSGDLSQVLDSGGDDTAGLVKKNTGSKENAESSEYSGDLSQVLDSCGDDTAGRIKKNTGSKEIAESSGYSGELSQVLDSGVDDAASLHRSLSSERGGSGREVEEREGSNREELESEVVEREGPNREVLEKEVVEKGGSNREVVEKAGSKRELLERERSDSKNAEELASDQVVQSSKLSNEGDAEKSEGDVEKSEITCESASPGDSESTDSDTSESDEPDIVQPFLSGELEGSNLVEDTEENLSTAESEKKTKSHTDEDFTTWQRIIRLDAVRANSEWVIYSTSQASITEMKARRFAESVGLKDYEHLEPCRIFHAARLLSILEAYALYDPEIGYCQGMSDLLSPIVSVIEDDSEAFWCFVGFMKKARHNFRLDEVGIRRQLNIVSKIIKCKDSHLFSHLEKLKAEDCFFVYRMVVVLFRRELNFDQTLCLWEVIWADQAAIRAGIARSAWGRMRPRAPPNDDLLLYAIAASVLQRRKLIIEKYSSMEEIMRECNSMAGHLDVWKLLDDAHDLVVNLQEKI